MIPDASRLVVAGHVARALGEATIMGWLVVQAHARTKRTLADLTSRLHCEPSRGSLTGRRVSNPRNFALIGSGRWSLDALLGLTYPETLAQAWGALMVAGVLLVLAIRAAAAPKAGSKTA